jgi:DNA recombination protein RmuC
VQGAYVSNRRLINTVVAGSCGNQKTSEGHLIVPLLVSRTTRQFAGPLLFAQFFGYTPIMMTTLLIGIFLALCALAAGIFLLWRRLASVAAPRDDQHMSMLNQNIQGVQRRMDATTKMVQSQLQHAADAVSRVSKELGTVQEMGRHMQELQDFLKSPKLRGNIGEQVLRDLLEQSFSTDHFSIQHKFQDGQIVDAIVRTDKGIIPIDAKFPLENFQKFAKAETDATRAEHRKLFLRDVKKHISDIAKKYILPHEGTVDFAVMYVPSESVHYELIRDDSELHGYAHEKKILIVSPNSFYYFLRVLMIGLEGKKIEENIRRVQELLGGMSQDAVKVGDAIGVLNTHVSNARGAVDRVNTEYAKLSGKIDQVRLLK